MLYWYIFRFNQKVENNDVHNFLLNFSRSVQNKTTKIKFELLEKKTGTVCLLHLLLKGNSERYQMPLF